MYVTYFLSHYLVKEGALFGISIRYRGASSSEHQKIVKFQASEEEDSTLKNCLKKIWMFIKDCLSLLYA